MTTKIKGTEGVEFPDASVQATAADAGPAFSAKNLSIQNMTPSVYAQFLFPTEIFDFGACYDPSTNRFNPKVAGFYQLNAMAFLSGDGAVTNVEMILRKNGVDTMAAARLQSTANIYNVLNINHLEYFNGTTDYADITGRIIGTAPVYIQGSAAFPALFSGFLARRV